MRTSRWRRAKWVLVVAVLLAAAYVETHYRPWLYRGGRLLDHGIFSEPRYEAVFADIRLNAPGTYTYTFSRFPARKAGVVLLTPDRPSLAAVQDLSTRVRFRVVGADGTTYCDAVGAPRDRLAWGLKVSSSDRVDGLAHDSCGDLRLRECNPCRLEVSIGPVDPATPPVRLVVTLAGGGISLP
jgi:hypothetical protein